MILCDKKPVNTKQIHPFQNASIYHPKLSFKWFSYLGILGTESTAKTEEVNRETSKNL